MRYYLLLGSNIGDRMGNLATAREYLKRVGLEEIQRSQIYESLPWGFRPQPLFLNQVVAIDTSLSPLELLRIIKNIEARMGRRKTIRYGPRKIDIDILMIEGRSYQDEDLIIPHSHLPHRPFAHLPLRELIPLPLPPISKGEVWSVT